MALVLPKPIRNRQGDQWYLVWEAGQDRDQGIIYVRRSLSHVISAASRDRWARATVWGQPLTLNIEAQDGTHYSYNVESHAFPEGSVVWKRIRVAAPAITGDGSMTHTRTGWVAYLPEIDRSTVDSIVGAEQKAYDTIVAANAAIALAEADIAKAIVDAEKLARKHWSEAEISRAKERFVNDGGKP